MHFINIRLNHAAIHALQKLKYHLKCCLAHLIYIYFEELFASTYSTQKKREKNVSIIHTYN